ncbi:MAG: hypothetical protein FWG20_01295 [Candidatus Cloacimonetes bacterium]|nr:hypothetical protein [Candidatus Cloacimonadota bacterium]
MNPELTRLAGAFKNLAVLFLSIATISFAISIYLYVTKNADMFLSIHSFLYFVFGAVYLGYPKKLDTMVQKPLIKKKIVLGMIIYIFWILLSAFMLWLSLRYLMQIYQRYAFVKGWTFQGIILPIITIISLTIAVFYEYRLLQYCRKNKAAV